AYIISKFLEKFSAISGKEVSKRKARVFYSTNVNMSKSSTIGIILGIAATQDLGRYLGVPIIHSEF
ncbi:hypothetical protein LINGRAHAP2_LOCUS32262, partial [Linum grandiflorum]